jgi:uncharacterized surface protein with fasciclin (FAS1) repeats
MIQFGDQVRKCVETKYERTMRTMIKLATLVLATSVGFTANAQKEKTVEVGGAPMYPSKNIIENAVNSKDHTTLVAAVKAAGLVETLSSTGPFTVFAPTNAAFDKLPKGTVDNLLKPENKGQLTGVLTYHVLAGKFNAKDVMAAIKKNGGKATMKTVAGGDLTFSMKGDSLVVWDASGGMAMVTIADVNQSNGVIHVVDSVLLPKM